MGHHDDSPISPVIRNITKLLDILVKRQFPDVRQLIRPLKSIRACSLKICKNLENYYLKKNPQNCREKKLGSALFGNYGRVA